MADKSRVRDWQRLGDQLLARRESMDDGRYKDRTVFAGKRGINYRMASDLELAKPADGSRSVPKDDTLRTVVAPAYAVTYESITDVLDNGGDLVPLPEPGAGQPARTAPGGLVSVLSADPAEIGPFIDEVWAAVRRASVRHRRAELAGAEIFGDPDEARQWELDVLDEQTRVRLIAAIRMLRARDSGSRAQPAV